MDLTILIVDDSPFIVDGLDLFYSLLFLMRVLGVMLGYYYYCLLA